MTLRSIAARFECDGCGRVIPDVYMDPATENITDGMSWAESSLKDQMDTSIQHDLHLCATCTTVADRIPDPSDPENVALADNYQPTRDEILAAIKERM